MKNIEQSELSQNLSRWYKENKRALPWRMSCDPYKIWVSEVMLQQTTVTAVKPYYEKFINTFPDVQALAKAKEERVLSLWSGLGYYSRARNLQKAAKTVVNLGYFPKTYEDLIKLSGIGPYTAAAIASIAFEEEIAAIDGNVNRVISRLFDVGENINAPSGKSIIKKYANILIKDQTPSVHNQAMMELGATICTPKNPGCLICPVYMFCKARARGIVLERPVKKKMKKQESWVWQMDFVKNPQGKIALVRSENGTPWLNHLWVLPGQAKKWKKPTEPKSDFRHSITHHKIYVQLKTPKYSNYAKIRNVKWMTLSEIKKVGTSSIVVKALKHHDDKVME